jgi:hypothetical protein
LIYARLNFEWWWLPVLFLMFDLSSLGYLINTRVGAITYNAVHNYLAISSESAVSKRLSPCGRA